MELESVMDDTGFAAPFCPDTFDLKNRIEAALGTLSHVRRTVFILRETDDPGVKIVWFFQAESD